MRPVYVGIRDPFDYDHNFAFEAYIVYLAGFMPIDYLCAYHRMFAVMTIRRTWPLYGDRLLEDVAQHVCLALWIAVTNRRLPEDTSKAYRAYLHKIVLNRARNYLRLHWRERPKACQKAAGLWTGDYTTRYPTVHDVDAKVLVEEEIPKYLLREILRSFRFPINRAATLVRYLVECIYRRKPISKRWISDHFDVADPEFLVEHVRVRIRMLLYEYRAENAPKAHSRVFDLRAAASEIKHDTLSFRR